MIPRQTNYQALLNGYSEIKDLLNEGMHIFEKAAVKASELIKKVAVCVLTIFLTLTYPGAMMFGVGIGLAIGVASSSPFFKESLQVISEIWKKQYFVTILVTVYWGYPYTPSIVAILRGAYIGFTEVLSVKSDQALKPRSSS